MVAHWSLGIRVSLTTGSTIEGGLILCGRGHHVSKSTKLSIDEFYIYDIVSAHASKLAHRRIVKALCNYAARADTDISFHKGDRMEVLSDAEPDWWRVLHLTTRMEGLIPVNYVAEETSVESEELVY